MGKTSLKDILDGYLDTLKEQPRKPGSAFDKHDLLVQIALPIGAALLYGTAWPLTGEALDGMCSNVVTGVSIVSSLMCGVAVMIFQLRVQLAAPGDVDASEAEAELVDETFSDVLWTVVVGFAAVLLLILGDVAGAIAPVLRRVLVSVSIGLVTNLAIVTCMGLKRMNASYLIVARVWGKGKTRRS